MDNQSAISVKELNKSFNLPHEEHSGIKQAIIGLFQGGKRGYETQDVLKEVSFEIKKGEFFGIVGRNGSGKSTLLKLLAGIYSPDNGHIQVNGSLTPFIELGVGFNQELTGRENVFLNGALLGFGRKEMESMYDDIVSFAELERFMDQKLKNYSSGMQVRLAFSIAIRADSDILLLDEVLAVGDEAFQRKCFDYFAQLKISKKTVILVTHGMDNVNEFCDRAMLLSDGRIEHIGGTHEITDLYEKINLPEPSTEIDPVVKDNKSKLKEKIQVALRPTNKKGERTKQFLANDKIIIEATITAEEYLKDVFLGISIHKPNGEAVFVKTTEKDNESIGFIEPGIEVKVIFDIQNIFAEDTYYVNASVKSNDRSKTYLIKEDTCRFRIASGGLHKNSLRPEYEIKIKKSDSK